MAAQDPHANCHCKSPDPDHDTDLSTVCAGAVLRYLYSLYLSPDSPEVVARRGAAMAAHIVTFDSGELAKVLSLWEAGYSNDFAAAVQAELARRAAEGR